VNRRGFLKLMGIGGLTLPAIGKMGENESPSTERPVEPPKAAGMPFNNKRALQALCIEGRTYQCHYVNLSVSSNDVGQSRSWEIAADIIDNGVWPSLSTLWPYMRDGKIIRVAMLVDKHHMCEGQAIMSGLDQTPSECKVILRGLSSLQERKI